jgi:serine/arginine repetitive matrix protein 2
MFFRSATPTIGGLLAPPGQKQMEEGPIALCVIRSMRSLATIGSWAQLKGLVSSNSARNGGGNEEGESEGERLKEKKKKKDGMVKEKKKKEGTVKKKKKAKEDSDKKSQKEKNRSRTVKKSIKGVKTQTTWISISSFKVGHLSASPEVPKATMSKKYSILGLGLLSAMRLPRMRRGSTASSLNLCS